jgi:hypothetical protein
LRYSHAPPPDMSVRVETKFQLLFQSNDISVHAEKLMKCIWLKECRLSLCSTGHGQKDGNILTP